MTLLGQDPGSERKRTFSVLTIKPRSRIKRREGGARDRKGTEVKRKVGSAPSAIYTQPERGGGLPRSIDTQNRGTVQDLTLSPTSKENTPLPPSRKTGEVTPPHSSAPSKPTLTTLRAECAGHCATYNLPKCSFFTHRHGSVPFRRVAGTNPTNPPTRPPHVTSSYRH